MEATHHHPSDVTRREALRRGIAVGGTLAWTVPAVQVINMSRAFAQTASPAPHTPPPPENGTPPPQSPPPQGGGGPTPPAPQVGGVRLTPPAQPTPGPAVQAAGQQQPKVAGQVLPQTGMNAAPLAGMGGMLTGAGLVALGMTKAIERRMRASEDGSPPRGGKHRRRRSDPE